MKQVKCWLYDRSEDSVRTVDLEDDDEISFAPDLYCAEHVTAVFGTVTFICVENHGIWGCACIASGGVRAYLTAPIEEDEVIKLLALHPKQEPPTLKDDLN